MDMINNNPNINWNRYGISSNSNLTMEMIIKCPISWWNWYDISKNSNLSLISKPIFKSKCKNYLKR